MFTEYAKSAAHVRQKFQMSGEGVNSRWTKCPARGNLKAKCPSKKLHLTNTKCSDSSKTFRVLCGHGFAF